LVYKKGYEPLEDVSALLIVAGFFLDPDIGASGRELAKSYAENPGRIQLSADALHFAFAFLAVPVLGLVVVIRGGACGWPTPRGSRPFSG
jgi:hypothetical protein